MADGLPGHEHDFYRLVKHSPWLGGYAEYSPLNEAFPYWFNGLVPLAYGLDDERLKAEVWSAAKHIISHQQEDGWLGPETHIRQRNLWGRYPVFLGLAQLAEVEPDGTRSGTIIAAMHRFVNLMHLMLSDNYQGYVWHSGDEFDEQWGRSRAADMVLALQWLYENRPENNTHRIWECMMFLYEQAYDWSYWFSEDVYIKTDLDMSPVELTNCLFPYVHGVNAGQGLKWGAVFRRLTGNHEHLNSTRNGVDWTFRYHGAPSGGIIGDERLAGLSPVRGVELCSVVETMFSLSYLYQALGDSDFADRCELAAFNALPTMVMPNWWAHQYIAQTNQPISHELSRPPFWNVGPWGQTFGIEPNYPCCTVNFPQGYPKFLSASFVRHGRNGVAHALLGAAEVRTTTGDGVNVHILCRTNYPFDHILHYVVSSDGAFNFSFRVPGWSILEESSVLINDQRPIPLRPDQHSGMQTLNLTSGTHVLVVELGAEIRVEPRANDTVAIYHGALLYSAAYYGKYRSRPPARYPAGSGAPPEAHDWTITPIWPPGPVAVDPSTLQFHRFPHRDEVQLRKPIWEENASPVMIAALVCEIEWDLVDGYAPNPPKKEERHCTSRAFNLGLIPYGAAKLHLAELPTIELKEGLQVSHEVDNTLVAQDLR